MNFGGNCPPLTTEVGNVIRGQGFRITTRSKSVVRSITRICFEPRVAWHRVCGEVFSNGLSGMPPAQWWSACSAHAHCNQPNQPKRNHKKVRGSEDCLCVSVCVCVCVFGGGGCPRGGAVSSLLDATPPPPPRSGLKASGGGALGGGGQPPRRASLRDLLVAASCWGGARGEG